MSRIVAKEYWTKKQEIDLYIYRKYEGSPEGKPVLFLIHGSSLSSRPGYDIQVPGRGSDYSMMDHCASAGFDVWTMDHEGYGRSSRSERNSDVEMALEDLDCAIALIEKETGQSTAFFYGQSGGALRAALYAQMRPRHVIKVVLDAFVWTGRVLQLSQNVASRSTSGNPATFVPSTRVSCIASSPATNLVHPK